MAWPQSFRSSRWGARAAPHRYGAFGKKYSRREEDHHASPEWREGGHDFEGHPGHGRDIRPRCHRAPGDRKSQKDNCRHIE